jgi:hypothetical protein
LNAAQVVTFTTMPYPKFNGTVLDNVDATGGWWQPSASGSTIGVLNPTFKIVASPKYSGSGSGMISYQWQNTSGGVCREHNSSGYSIESGALVGLWIYGDNSGNDLELWFYYSTTFTAVSVGSIDWTGWKLVTVPVSSIPSGNRRFASVVIKQKAGAAMSGAIYIDALSIGTSVSSVNRESGSVLPESYRLEQNYPNPFNPSTHIQFSIPAAQAVRLSVHDVLGRECAALVNETLQAGTYTIDWNAGAFPSGVYFYTLRAGSFSQTKKLLLNK